MTVGGNSAESVEPVQLGLREGVAAVDAVPETYANLGRSLLAVVRDVVHASGKQCDDFAVDLGVDPGQFSRALNDRGANFSLLWLAGVMAKDPGHLIAHKVASLARGAFVPAPDLSDAQKLALLEAKVRDEFGKSGERAIVEAYGSAP